MVMEAMLETMVLKRKYSPTPQDWDNSSNQDEDPASPCSSTDETCNGATKPKKKRKKRVKFNGVTVYYFRRSQGFTCVPSQGGSTLGMEHLHDSQEKYSLNGFALEQDRQHRQLLKEQLLERKHQQMVENGEPGPVDNDINEIDADNELNKINVEEYYFLQPVTTKRRRLMLRSAGVKKIESWEKSELKTIRLSREKCGCDCKVFCNPLTCACSLAGIKCQVDRLSFPCGCSKDGCNNKTGRVEFNPIKVRTHFLHTLMRLEVENGPENGLCDKSLDAKENDNTNQYTELENSVCFDESTDCVLDHGQCKECDSLTYNEYSGQYASSQYLNGPKLGKSNLKLDTPDLYSHSSGIPMGFTCDNTDMPLDLQLQSNANNIIPCVLTYGDETKNNTLNSGVNHLCNVPTAAVSGYYSSTSEESLSSESESDSPYLNTTPSITLTNFASTSSEGTLNHLLHTPDSPPEEQFTKLMPLDLSHGLDEQYEANTEAPTYTELNSSLVALCSRNSEALSMSSPSLRYTIYGSDHSRLNINETSLFTNNERLTCSQTLNTMPMCSIDNPTHLLTEYSEHPCDIVCAETITSTIPLSSCNEPPTISKVNIGDSIECISDACLPVHGTVNKYLAYDGTLNEHLPCDEPVKESMTSDGTTKDSMSSDETVKDSMASDGAVKKCIASDGTLKECMASDETVKECMASDGTTKDSIMSSDERVKDSMASDGAVKECIASDGRVKECIASDETVKECMASGGIIKECMASDGAVKECIASDGTVNECMASDGTVKECIASDGTVNECMASDGTVKECMASDGTVKESIASDGTVKECIASDGTVKECMASDGTVKECMASEVEVNIACDGIMKKSMPSDEMVKEKMPCDTTVKECMPCDTTVKENMPSDGMVKGSIQSDGTVKESVLFHRSVQESMSSDGTVKLGLPSEGALVDVCLPSDVIMEECASSDGAVEAYLLSDGIVVESLPGNGMTLAENCLPTDETDKCVLLG